MLNNGKIFVGSSSEAESLANGVVGRLVEEAGMELVPWNTIFKAGGYPLEAFEKTFANELTGAVLLATPDVFGKRGDASFDAPVANVVLEYGYLAARLGRSRVAICQFDDAELPSDLQGLTNIRVGKYEEDGQSFQAEAATKLSDWLGSLPPLAEEIPPRRQFHGYSGKWEVKSTFTLWRGREVQKRTETVSFNGSAFLLLEGDGKRGWGMQTGVLSVSLDGGGYRETRKIYNDLSAGSLDRHGTVKIGVKVRERVLMGDPDGIPPDDLREDWLKDPDAAPSFNVELRPDPGRPKSLTGKHVFEPGRDPHQQAEEHWSYIDL